MEIIMQKQQVAVAVAIFNCLFAFHLVYMFADTGHKCHENNAEILKSKCFLKVGKENCMFPLATLSSI